MRRSSRAELAVPSVVNVDGITARAEDGRPHPPRRRRRYDRKARVSGAREKIWVVRAQEGTSLVAILKRAGEDERALADGAFFIGKKRVAHEQR